MTIDDFIALIDRSVLAPATPKQIANFELLVRHALPSDYRQFLTSSGGGLIGSNVEYTLGEMSENVVTVGGLRSGKTYSLRHHVADPGFGPLPQHLIWIGDDSSGNPIALSLRDDRLGEIFIIDHELCSFEEERETIEAAEDYGLAMSIAASFTAFVALLEVVPDEETADLT